MKLIKSILSRCVIIVTCICVAVPLFDVLLGDEMGEVSIMLIQIVTVGLLTSMGELLIFNIDFFKVSKKTVVLRMIIYYIYVNVCVIGFGSLIGWFDIHNPFHTTVMAIIIFLIFVLNYLASYIKDSSDSKKINERLEQMRNNADKDDSRE